MGNMKKLIASMLLVVIILNFIFLNKPCLAAGLDDNDDITGIDSAYTNETTPSEEILSNIGNEGESYQKQSISFASFGTSIVGTVLGILARLINLLIAVELDIIIAQLTFAEENDELKYFITIDRLVFNRVPALNSNYFNFDSTYKVGKDLELQADEYNNMKIKESIASVYRICRTLALIAGLAVLVYIGIRMAISTIAVDQARYKKMLIAWVESIVIIFLIPTIISILFVIEESLTTMFFNLRCAWLDNYGTGGYLFEDLIRNKCFSLILSTSGIELTMWSIIYWLLIYMEIKFLWTYVKRFFMLGFLIAISPLVTITYSIDKAGDGRAQAFSNWLKEIILNILIQPLHALIYLVIVVTANNIVATSPVIAILLLLSMGRVEKMVRTVFNISDSVTFNGITERLLRRGR